METHAEGSPEAVDEYLAWLERGPPYARVEEVRSRTVEFRGYSSFDIED